MYIIKRKIHKKIEKFKISIFKIKLQQEQTKRVHDEQEQQKSKHTILKLKFKIKKGRSSVLNSAKKISQIDEKYKYRSQKNLHEDLDVYDPFQTPPNFIKAQRHHQATSIGVPQIQTGSLKDMQVCPCCQNLINKQPISICCDEEQLLFLGVGYPLYYRLTKYIVLIVLFVFIVSGSGLYYLMTVDCRQQCISFYGLMIIDFELQKSESNRVQIMNMITAIGIFIFGLYIKSLINKDISVLQSKVICPSQYTIMLQNLPKDYEEYELKNWIKQKFGYNCILVNIGYNVQELQSSYQKRNTLTIQLNKLYIKRQRTLKQQKSKNNHMNSSNKLSLKLINPEDRYQYEKERQLITQIQKLDQIINNYQNNLINIDKNGTAFVTFQNAETVQQILQKYQQMQILGFFTRTLSKLLRVNALQFKGKIVKVSRAPAPRQVIWHNLQYSHFKSFAFQIFFMISMFLLIYFAFQYQFKFSAYAYKLRTEGKE